MAKINYTRIKKPKKDELLIFALPDELPNSPRHKHFTECLRRAVNDTSNRSQFLVMTGNIKIHKAKKKQIKNGNPKISD